MFNDPKGNVHIYSPYSNTILSHHIHCVHIREQYEPIGRDLLYTMFFFTVLLFSDIQPHITLVGILRFVFEYNLHRKLLVCHVCQLVLHACLRVRVLECVLHLHQNPLSCMLTSYSQIDDQ